MNVIHCFKVRDFFRKLTERLVTGIELWKLYFQIRARCALASAFDKIAGTKKIAGKRFFFSQTFFFRQTLFFAGNAFHQKK
jgi:hypothetical protein